jgi:hypothetical protein
VLLQEPGCKPAGVGSRPCASNLHRAIASGANYHPSGDEIHAKLLDQTRQGPVSGSNTEGGTASLPSGPVSIDDYIRFWGGSPLPGSSSSGQGSVNSTSSNSSAAVGDSAGRRLLRNLLGVWPSYAEGSGNVGAVDKHRHRG